MSRIVYTHEMIISKIKTNTTYSICYNFHRGIIECRFLGFLKSYSPGGAWTFGYNSENIVARSFNQILKVVQYEKLYSIVHVMQINMIIFRNWTHPVSIINIWSRKNAACWSWSMNGYSYMQTKHEWKIPSSQIKWYMRISNY